jgi:hypothetical protein
MIGIINLSTLMGLVCSCAEARNAEYSETAHLGPVHKGGLGCADDALCASAAGREKLPIIRYEDHSRPYTGRFQVDDRVGPIGTAESLEPVKLL